MQVGGAAARKIALLEHPHKDHHADDHPPEQPGGLAGRRTLEMAGKNDCHDHQAEQIVDDIAQGIHIAYGPPMRRFPFYYTTLLTKKYPFLSKNTVYLLHRTMAPMKAMLSAKANPSVFRRVALRKQYRLLTFSGICEKIAALNLETREAFL